MPADRHEGFGTDEADAASSNVQYFYYKEGDFLKKHIVFASVLAFALTLAVASHAKSELQASWDKGLRFKSEDKSFSLKLGGRIQNDWAWFNQSDEHLAAYGNWQDGTEFRRIRLYMSGTVYKNIIFKAQYDFAGANAAGKEVSVKDMFIGYQGIPFVGTFLVGHQKEPFGLEVLTSSKYVTFMERSPLTIFDSERNMGMAFQNSFANKRITAHAGVFKTTDNGGKGTGDGRNAITGRVTGLPWHDKDRNAFFHVGGAYSYRSVKNEGEWAVRPSSHLAGKMIQTGDLMIDKINAMGLEGAFVYGPFSAQGEYKTLTLDASMYDDPSFGGFYAYGSFFITGESRAYKTSRGVFDRVKPKKDFLGEEKGPGAWEVALRYTSVDLNDKEIYGGELSDITAGVNWHLNPNTRVMFNYVYSKAENVGEEKADNGAVNIFETRFQIDF